VADNIDLNGLPMSIQRFDSGDDPGQILAFYRSAWAAAGKTPGPIEYEVGDFRVIATFRGGCFYTVQVKSSSGKKGGATGFLAVSSAPSRNPVKSDVPVMTGTEILNDITHNDDGKTARTVLLTNSFSPGANATFYQNDFTGKGWQILSSKEMTTQKGRGSVTVFSKGLREVSVTSVREGPDTHVLLNFVDSP